MINLSRLNPLRIPLFFLLLALISFADQAARYAPRLQEHFAYKQEGQDLLWNDFMVHWEVARFVVSGQPQFAYDAQQLTQVLRRDFGFFKNLDQPRDLAWSYFYPPTTLLALSPLGWFEYPEAALLFFSVTLLALLGVAICFAGAAGSLLVLGAPAVWICLWEGQNGFLTASLWGLFLLLLPRFKSGAGVALSGFVIKPHLVLAAPLALLSGREWRTFLVAAFMGLILLGGTAAFFDYSVCVDFLQKGVPAASLFILTNFMTIKARLISMYGTLILLGVAPSFALLVQTVWGLGVVASVAWVFRRCQDYNLRAAILALSALMISPMAYDYDLPISLIAIFALLRAGQRVPLRSWEWGLIAAVYFGPAFIYPEMSNQIGFNPVWLAVTLLYVAVLRRVAQATENALLRPL